jgi:Ca-activated chloride channel family protein
MSTLYWREPLWLLLAVLPLLQMGLRLLLQRRQAGRYADPALQPWVVLPTREGIGRRLFSKDGAYLAAWLLLAIAAAGPRLPLEIAGEPAAPDTDLMLVVDISRSMTAADVRPNRMRRAQIELEELLQRARGQRLGIIVFAARAHLYVPPTTDHAALRFYLQSLDALAPPTHGSRPAAALALAAREVHAASRKGAIILVTDGDFATWTPLQTTVADLARVNIPLYILGVGSAEGAAIPLPAGGWLTANGRAVISRLADSRLRRLAQATGGAYAPVRDDDSDWATLYDEGIARRFAAPPDLDPGRMVWRELYAWPLLPGVALLWFALLPFRLRLKGVPAALLAVSLFAPQPPAQAGEAEQAYKNYTRGDYAAALAGYKNLAGYSARLGEGVSRYQLKDYAGAVRQFQQAVLDANTDAQRGSALFDLGNSYFKLGNYATAAAVYKDALLYRPAHVPSRHNLAFSEALRQAVEERRRGSTTSRAGAGPQRATPSEALSVTGNASLALDESEAESKTGSLPALPVTSDKLEALIARGLAHVRLAAATAQRDAAAGRRPVDVARAQQKMEALQDSQALLWKRLFEMEEGFPASLEAPRTMPGVTPW